MPIVGRLVYIIPPCNPGLFYVLTNAPGQYNVSMSEHAAAGEPQWTGQPGNEQTLVRDARPEELDQVAVMMRDAYLEYQAHFPADVWERYARNIMDVRSRLDVSELIVAERGGHVVGSVTLYPNVVTAEQAWPPGWAGVRLLAVAPDARGEGIGRVLMDECLRRSRQRQAPAIGLHTSDIMRVARGLYERMGFVRAPEYDFRTGSDWVVMGYRLDL